MIFDSIKQGIYEIGLYNGNKWLKIFHHSYANKALFHDEDEASFILSNDKYSILSLKLPINFESITNLSSFFIILKMIMMFIFIGDKVKIQ